MGTKVMHRSCVCRSCLLGRGSELPLHPVWVRDPGTLKQSHPLFYKTGTVGTACAHTHSRTCPHTVGPTHTLFLSQSLSLAQLHTLCLGQQLSQGFPGDGEWVCPRQGLKPRTHTLESHTEGRHIFPYLPAGLLAFYEQSCLHITKQMQAAWGA